MGWSAPPMNHISVRTSTGAMIASSTSWDVSNAESATHAQHDRTDGERWDEQQLRAQEQHVDQYGRPDAALDLGTASLGEETSARQGVADFRAAPLMCEER